MIAWDKKSPGKKMELEEGPMDSCFLIARLSDDSSLVVVEKQVKNKV
jgi:hypothetical protein